MYVVVERRTVRLKVRDVGSVNLGVGVITKFSITKKKKKKKKRRDKQVR
jgi:hypothetical protein